MAAQLRRRSGKAPCSNQPSLKQAQIGAKRFTSAATHLSEDDTPDPTMFHVKHRRLEPDPEFLEEGSLARHAVAPGKLVGTKLGLAQNFVAKLLVDKGERCESELRQRSCWPTPSPVETGSFNALSNWTDRKRTVAVSRRRF
jgi:hypothetical protein